MTAPWVYKPVARSVIATPGLTGSPSLKQKRFSMLETNGKGICFFHQYFTICWCYKLQADQIIALTSGPVMCIIPDTADAMESYPGLCDAGPVCPYPEQINRHCYWLYEWTIIRWKWASSSQFHVIWACQSYDLQHSLPLPYGLEIPTAEHTHPERMWAKTWLYFYYHQSSQINLILGTPL